MLTRQQNKMPTSGGGSSYNARFDELESKLDKILELNASTNTLLNSVVQRMDAFDGRMENLVGEMHDQGVKLDTQENRVSKLERKMQLATDYIDQLENRHRQNNLRLLNVPEREERDLPMITFLVKTLKEKWSLTLKEEDFERAHRVGPIKDNAKHPRAIIFKLHHFQKKLQILKQAKGRQDGSNFRVVTDMSAQTRARRAEFWPLREQLHRLNVKTFLRHPATLCVEDGGTVMSFGSFEEAKVELQQKYPSIIKNNP
ncbi:uncharacterized protein LOC117816948 [Notolabrus celidotus]|uniref:uncharacterized protein LOC117816948 n=1 Tax=Notolabrus celidotus TaxID=1203425 RepID=UPI00148FA082|nr:uncharacterized protein LOC117816948 [Notolabrus celidotus]